MIAQLEIATRSAAELVDITAEVQRVVKEKGMQSGVCHVFVPHTTWQTFLWQGPQPPQSAQQFAAPQHGDAAPRPPAGACSANARQAAMVRDVAKSLIMIRSSL